jgi:glycosyltransferase involved in cell wall biosynthesis
MDHSTPDVSVLLPVYNARQFLPEALDSILSQTYTGFEVIAIDDGSTDGSGEILEQYARRDPRIRVFHQHNQAIVATLNSALAHARAPLVARMDADDVSRPDRFAKQAKFLAEHPDIDLVSGAFDLIDADGGYMRTVLHPTSPEAIAGELEYHNMICHPAVMARKAAIEAVGGYRESMIYAEDFDLWLRMAEKGKLTNLPDVILGYRQHRDKASTRHFVRQALAVQTARASARLRRAGKLDPFEAQTETDYVVATKLLRGASDDKRVSEFAYGFFRTVLAIALDLRITDWQLVRMYVLHGLRDIDADGARLFMRVFGGELLAQRGRREPLKAMLPTFVLGAATAIRHPFVAINEIRSAQYWWYLLRRKLLGGARRET